MGCNDWMGSFLRRVIAQLGMTGLIIAAAALIFGALAGGVVVHRLETAPTSNQEAQQSEASDQNDGEQKDNQDKQKRQGSGASHARTTEPPDSHESD